MFEHGLSGRLWPIRCKPYPDEMLTSWLVRLSRAYGADPTGFYAEVWPPDHVWNRDVDRGTDDHLISLLATKTATPRSRVLAATIRGYRGYRTEDLRVLRRPPWLLNLGMSSFTRRKPWLQYCPGCLQTDVDPYFRRSWRLAFVTVCPKHRRCLLDRCNRCDAVVNFHLLSGDAEAITLCYRCRDDLRSAYAPMIDERTDDDRYLLQFQTFLLKRLRSGRCQLGGFAPIRSVEFFDRLRRRMLHFLTLMHAPAFKMAFGNYLDASFFESHLTSVKRRSLEALEVEDRLLFMLFMSWWSEQWPEAFRALGS